MGKLRGEWTPASLRSAPKHQQEVSQQKNADRHQQKLQHSARGNNSLQLRNDRQRRDRQTDQLQEPSQCFNHLARISHTLLLHGGQVPAWLRQTAQFNPPRISNTYPVKLLVFLAGQALTTARDEECEKSGLARNHLKFPAGFAYSRKFVHNRLVGL